MARKSKKKTARKRTSRKPSARKPAKTSARPGRPQGSTGSPPPVKTVEIPRCGWKGCASTVFKVLQTTTKNIRGHRPDGSPYNVITWRRKQCKLCGKVHVHKSFDFKKPSRTVKK